MRRDGDMTGAGAGQTRLPTMGPRSVEFFAAIVLGPLALVLPFFAPLTYWTWAIGVVGLAALGDCFRRLYVAYFVSARGMVRRRWLGWDEIAWEDVEAVGRKEIRDRYGVVGIIVCVYAANKMFSPELRLGDGGEFEKRLVKECPKALWIDEDRGTFHVPAGVDSERVREVVRRHWRRLRRNHAARAAAALSVFAPYAVMVVHRGGFLQEDWKAIGVSLLAYAMLSRGHWAALWRLRG